MNDFKEHPNPVSRHKCTRYYEQAVISCFKMLHNNVSDLPMFGIKYYKVSGDETHTHTRHGWLITCKCVQGTYVIHSMAGTRFLSKEILLTLKAGFGSHHFEHYCTGMRIGIWLNKNLSRSDCDGLCTFVCQYWDIQPGMFLMWSKTRDRLYHSVHLMMRKSCSVIRYNISQA